MKKLVYVAGDDWCGIYIDEELNREGHSIPYFGWLELLKQGPFETEAVCADLDWLATQGRFPKYLDEVKFEA